MLEVVVQTGCLLVLIGSRALPGFVCRIVRTENGLRCREPNPH